MIKEAQPERTVTLRAKNGMTIVMSTKRSPDGYKGVAAGYTDRGEWLVISGYWEAGGKYRGQSQYDVAEDDGQPCTTKDVTVHAQMFSGNHYIKLQGMVVSHCMRPATIRGMAIQLMDFVEQHDVHPSQVFYSYEHNKWEIRK